MNSVKETIKKKWLFYALLILIGLQLVILIHFWFQRIMLSPMFDSDAASDVFYNKVLLDEKSFLFSDNWYPSTDVGFLKKIPFFGVLLSLTSKYSIAYGFSRIVMAVLFVGSAVLMLRMLDVSKEGLLMGALLSLIPYGSYHRYSTFSMFLGADYYTYVIVFPYLFIALWMIAKKKIEKPSLRLLIGLVLLFLSAMMGSMSVRFAFHFLLPFLLTEAVMALRSENNQNRWRSVVNLSLVCLSFAIGFLLKQKLIVPRFGGMDFTGLRFAEMAEIREQLWLVLDGIVKFFGYSPDGGNILSVMGVMNLLCGAYLVVVIVMLIQLLRKRDMIKDRKWLVYFFALQMICGFGTLILSYQRDVGAVQRYVWIAMAGMILIPALWFEEFVIAEHEEKRMKKTMILCIACGMVCFANDFNLISSYSLSGKNAESYNAGVLLQNYRNATPQDRQGYIDFCRENGLTYGYADFWDANITTILTNNELVISAAENDEAFSYKHWLSRKDFEDKESYPPQFYLYTINMEQQRLSNGWSVGNKELYRDDHYVIYAP